MEVGQYYPNITINNKNLMVMKSKYNYIQVYNVWVNGRDIFDVDQHFPILESNVETHTNWHNDFKKATNDYFKVKIKDKECKEGLYTEIYQNYHNDFKKATNDYFKVKIKDKESKEGLYTEIYQDYIVQLFSIDINIDEFEKKYKVKFDLDNDFVQEMIPYYVDYVFNTVAERICEFK